MVVKLDVFLLIAFIFDVLASLFDRLLNFTV